MFVIVQHGIIMKKGYLNRTFYYTTWMWETPIMTTNVALRGGWCTFIVFI